MSDPRLLGGTHPDEAPPPPAAPAQILHVVVILALLAALAVGAQHILNPLISPYAPPQAVGSETAPPLPEPSSPATPPAPLQAAPSPPTRSTAAPAGIPRHAPPAGPIRIVNGEHFGRDICWTFDDGPSPAITPRLLDILRRYNLKATFFVLGMKAALYPNLIRQIVAEGHTLGNHTYNHRNMATLSAEKIRWEMDRTQQLVDKALGYHYPLIQFRPPYGNMSNAVRAFVKTRKLHLILWTVDPQDWRGARTPAQIIIIIKAQAAERGGVILMHDTQPQALTVVPAIVEGLTLHKFRFRDVDWLLARKYGLSYQTLVETRSPLQQREDRLVEQVKDLAAALAPISPIFRAAALSLGSGWPATAGGAPRN